MIPFYNYHTIPIVPYRIRIKNDLNSIEDIIRREPTESQNPHNQDLPDVISYL